ncbi:Gfo/Idh/MocA family oxidoreductase [Actinotalea sp. M2MS4P-6]|uniref:Gfo/Idh/MocA family protein n=1 Tax=Actinotalea sp. M2MS4P-6 TaxID=2983762 RepID=UPI0021E4030F|nr:Gfo/Idh/MocA family oxidoreductase [Actinotalea sp. M2MS4P-6]MCV2394933.1 Gfo/Idh/MocA family oxidoreductase [Actinotalea sp. M2MS4P-6]
MPDPVRFAVVGSGWRSEFHLRIARAAPEALQAVAVVTRTASAGERIAARWGVPTVRTVAEALALEPDFVVADVTWPAMPVLIRELVAAGAKVLAETPPAPDLDGLRALWADVGPGATVQVGEQYVLMPGHAARLAVVGGGVIGAPTSVEISSTHLYHAVSLVRAFLGVGMAGVTVNARTFTAPLADPLHLGDWVDDPRPEPRTTTIATLDFGDGRMGLYDFVDNQWWNPLRARRLVVRGSLGEIVDDTVTRLTADGPVTSPIVYRRSGIDLNLEGNEVVHASFDGRVVYRNPWVGTRLSEDDIAVASNLAATGAWARGEAPGPYSLADACQDHAVGLAIEESARLGADVRVAPDVWA